MATSGSFLSNYGSIRMAEEKSIQEQTENSPISGYKNELLRAIEENQILLVVSETASGGNTTQITQYMVELGVTLKNNKIIGCTQSLCKDDSAILSNTKRVGEHEVGYSIDRFDNDKNIDMTSTNNKIIHYMTDGMLMREYYADNNLSRYATLVLGNEHERTVSTDILFGLLKNLCRRRKDLKLIVTCTFATFEAEKFSEYFFQCPIFSIPGSRKFPVKMMYVKEELESDYLELSIRTVMQIHLNQSTGDIIIFLTGQEEIDLFCKILNNRIPALLDDLQGTKLIVLPVYSALLLSSEIKSRILEPSPPGSRKCIVTTNISAEALLAPIDDIYYVIDPGFCKQKNVLNSFIVTPISQASANQRAMYAGRTGPGGTCYRLYTEQTFRTKMLPTNIPEIQRTNLNNVVLQLKVMGIHDVFTFDFIDPPPFMALVDTIESLQELGALDNKGKLTRLGRKMVGFPIEPIVDSRYPFIFVSLLSLLFMFYLFTGQQLL